MNTSAPNNLSPGGPAEDPENRYVSRGGLKLRHALDTFQLDPTGWTCADLGCSTGGFTDCLLQAGATKVISVDTAYGEFAWKLRKDPRVELRERTNALHAVPPPNGVQLVVIDLGWTPQRLVIPVAMKWLSPGGTIVSLIKPHYELKDEDSKALPPGGVLTEAEAEAVTQRVVERMPSYGVRVLGLTRSPVLGGKQKSGKARGNLEWLIAVTPDPNAPKKRPPVTGQATGGR